MTRQEFIAKLQSLIELGDDFKALVFFAVKGGDGITIKKANIKQTVLNSLAVDFKQIIQDEITKFENDNERLVLNLSDRDERANVIYRYDLPDSEPSFFNSMRQVVEQHPADFYTNERMFNFDVDSLSSIDYFITILGTEDNKIVIYRNNFNINLLKQGRGKMYITKSGTQFDIVCDDILRLDMQIDALLIENDFYILNLKYLDNNKEFATIIINRAEKSVDKIQELELVDDIEELRNRLLELSFSRRLMRAFDSSPVTEMPKNIVLDFIRNHDKLKNILKIENDKIKLSSKKSQDSFVRLLNDDFLFSKLTQNDYESMSKNILKED